MSTAERPTPEQIKEARVRAGHTEENAQRHQRQRSLRREPEI